MGSTAVSELGGAVLPRGEGRPLAWRGVASLNYDHRTGAAGTGGWI